jgi:hypothetical protein
MNLKNLLLNSAVGLILAGGGMGLGTWIYKIGYDNGFNKGHITVKPSGVTVQVHWFTPKNEWMESTYSAGDNKFKRTIDTFGVNGYALGIIKSFWADGVEDNKIHTGSTLPEMKIADTAHNKY